MRVAVIGGTRHIGPPLLRMLVEAGHQVLALNRGRTPAALPPGARHLAVDRAVPGQVATALREASPDAVIDLIGYAAAEVEETLSAVPSSRHYVFCSSTAVYGRIGRATPDEATPVAPDSPYTTGKVACEEALLAASRQRGLPVTILRLAHPYGPGDHLLYTSGRESLFLDRMRRGRPILIPGVGRTRIHPIYVGDVARAFVHVLERPGCPARAYNLGGEEILTLDEYFASLARVLGVPLVARKLPAEFFRDHAPLWAGWRRHFDFGFNWVHYESAFDVRALRESGFRWQTDHDAGAALTVEWLESRELVPSSSDEDEEDRILALRCADPV